MSVHSRACKGGQATSLEHTRGLDSRLCRTAQRWHPKHDTLDLVFYLPPTSCPFEFIIVTALRTKQLQGGCLPRVAPSSKFTGTAAAEVLAGKVARLVEPPV